MRNLADPYAISIDIGTSTVAVHLLSLETGKVISQCRIQNPQIRFGLDIITRAKFASQSKSNMNRISSLIRNSIWSTIDTLINRERLNDPSSIVVCGNTVMQNLFYKKSVDTLLTSPFRVRDSSATVLSARELGWPFDTEVYSPPLVESFVGSDAISVLVDALHRYPSDTMLVIDVGTNTEISLIDGDRIWITSAPSGPAFEGMSVSCGMSAEIGAIRRVRLGTHCNIRWSTIGDTLPRGICGTGIISLMAELIRAGLITEHGSLSRKGNSPCMDVHSTPVRFIVADAAHSFTGRPIFLTQIDIRMVQQSKAAIRGAVEMIFRRSALSPADIDRIYITGAFGDDLDLDDAYDIGMFPPLDGINCHQEIGGAIRGADLLNLDRSYRDFAQTIAQRSNYIDLMEDPEFDEVMALSQVFSRQ